MNKEYQTDVVVIGGGPGGYVAAIRLRQLGVQTMLIEKEDALGGTCLNVGCIPSKSLIHAAKIYKQIGQADKMGIRVSAPIFDMEAMQGWKGKIVSDLTRGVRGLLTGNGVQIVTGRASFVKKQTDVPVSYRIAVKQAQEEIEVVAKHVVIATGSVPRRLETFPVDQTCVFDSTGMLELKKVPDRMIVLGGGYIGLELGMAYARFGTKVTVIEMMSQLLAGMDRECVSVLQRKMKALGMDIRLEASVESFCKESSGLTAVVQDKKGTKETLEADVLFVSVGRVPNIADLGLEAVGVSVDEEGFIAVDAMQRTNVERIYALGDVTAGPMLAHKASKEGEVVAEVIAGREAEMDVQSIPAVVFTDPVLASIGMTKEKAESEGYAVSVGKFPFAASGRALSTGDTDGFVKVVAQEDSREILGVHMVGNDVAEMIAEAGLSIEMGAVLEDVAGTVHAHPTLSESLMEAAKAAMGEAIHIVNR